MQIIFATRTLWYYGQIQSFEFSMHVLLCAWLKLHMICVFLSETSNYCTSFRKISRIYANGTKMKWESERKREREMERSDSEIAKLSPELRISNM